MPDIRLIERAFPLRQVSLDSVHEKNVRHGHVSTLHIWPARRPLAAGRAALLATLLPGPSGLDERRELLERIAGRIVEVPNASSDRMKEETRGGILHWGRESRNEGAAGVAKLRDEVRAAFGGRAPRVLDPFAGGGAIPLEAIRLGCEAVAADLNPVAWFILRCTLHYPHRLAGQARELPAFALRNQRFVEGLLKARGITGKTALREELARLGHCDGEPVQVDSLRTGDDEAPASRADLAWHLRAWGQRVLDEVRRQLAARYPTYAEFEPVRRKGRRGTAARPPERRYRPRPARLLVPDEHGRVSTDSLNAEFDSLYLENDANPRWIAKPPVAYLWARTVRCRGCRAETPLLKTRWLCRKEKKRVLLTLHPGKDDGRIDFGVERGVPEGHGSAAQRREHDRTLGAGTMSGSGATCPSCGAIATTKDIRIEGQAGRLGERMTAVVVDGQEGKEYRLPTEIEIEAAHVTEEELDRLYAKIPFGLPDEPISPERPSPNSRGASGLPRYGFGAWRRVFTNRQLLAMGTFIRSIRHCAGDMDAYPETWREALLAYLAPSISRLADRGCALATWTNNHEQIRNTFARFALPMVWDFAESCPVADTTGGFIQAVEWVARVVEHTEAAALAAPAPSVAQRSATAPQAGRFDLVCTDPPYYDAIPYSDLMDFFHVWLRRTLHGLSPEIDAVFSEPLGPKWNRDTNDGELVDQPSRFDGNRAESRQVYEDGMLRTFERCRDALVDDGRLVVVFANKQPDAWETLVSALIRANFVVTASWPIQTERESKVAGGARLSSSIWLVCKKRPASARPGWDGRVLADMRENITGRLHDFWDAGIRGPDFVWAATGPALEAFSRHPVVRKADSPGERLTVAEFLRRVRRIVVGFVVSRLLAQDGGAEGELDDPTTYYLLHRSDFGLRPAPAGACILYALSCNLSDADLAGRLDLLARGGRAATTATDAAATATEEDAAEPEREPSGSEARLKPWSRRRARDLGEPSLDGSPPPLIDCVHKLMQLWKTGQQSRVDAYLEARGLWRHELFARVVQALIELAEGGSEERTTLESIQNHIGARGGAAAPRQETLQIGESS